MHIYKAGPRDYRVRVRVAGKWRNVGTFASRAEAECYRDARKASLRRSRKKRSKVAMRSRKRRARVTLRQRLRRLWRRLTKRR